MIIFIYNAQYNKAQIYANCVQHSVRNILLRKSLSLKVPF